MFHEATVVKFGIVGRKTTIHLELAGSSAEGNKFVTIFVLQTSELKIDQEVLETENDFDLMHFEDGEVLSFETRSDGIEVLIEWNDFNRRCNTTRLYKVVGSSVVTHLS
ncbi:hypothetical protein [Maritalea porphyrae]|jgi:hypothetical protein|uniref:hypothetical protein n=1 Tax=Maritalea porphyrae TaxID=880732 RepID=UPI0022AF29E4|nr:hypothetical protein [Maritalea porphyrae]MCZ4271239.1 hypothetical protein [Maritalea porphyrae]